MSGGYRWRRIGIAVRRNPLTLSFYAATLALVIVSCYGLYDLLRFARDQESALVSQRLQSDLRAFVGALNTDDGSLIRANLRDMGTTERPVTPLESPKRWFIADPGSDQAAQRPSPPRACYVTLQAGRPGDSTLSVCAYVLRESGWVYVHLTYEDSELRSFQAIDPTGAHDAIEVSFVEGLSRRTWRLRFLEAAEPARYRLSADALHEPGDPQVGEYFQGWAYIAPRDRVVAMFRFRFGALGAHHVADRLNGVWPARICAVRLEFARDEVDPSQPHRIIYPSIGKAERDVRDLYLEHVKTGARVTIEDSTRTNARPIWTQSSLEVEERQHFARLNPAWPVIDRYWSGATLASHSEPIADTNLVATIEQDEVPINRSTLRAISWMSLLLALLIVMAFGFGAWVVGPVRRMSRQARALAQKPLSAGSGLAYASRRTELGTLARAFNLILRNARVESERRIRERQAHEDEQRRRETEQMREREKNLRMVGHEIRSPLQALLSYHPGGHPARRYVERMIRAVQWLYGSSNAEAAFAGASLVVEQADIVPLLREIARNAPRAGIPDVLFEGTEAPVKALFDESALEDSITHILNNAHRYRHAGTPIRLRLSVTHGDDGSIPRVHVLVVNQGPNIPADLLTKIFEYGVSAGDRRDATNEGQGLFAAQNYATKMGGSISAINLEGGVAFDIELCGAPRD